MRNRRSTTELYPLWGKVINLTLQPNKLSHLSMSCLFCQESVQASELVLNVLVNNMAFGLTIYQSIFSVVAVIGLVPLINLPGLQGGGDSLWLVEYLLFCFGMSSATASFKRHLLVKCFLLHCFFDCWIFFLFFWSIIHFCLSVHLIGWSVQLNSFLPLTGFDPSWSSLCRLGFFFWYKSTHA